MAVNDEPVESEREKEADALPALISRANLDPARSSTEKKIFPNFLLFRPAKTVYFKICLIWNSMSYSTSYSTQFDKTATFPPLSPALLFPIPFRSSSSSPLFSFMSP